MMMYSVAKLIIAMYMDAMKRDNTMPLRSYQAATA